MMLGPDGDVLDATTYREQTMALKRKIGVVEILRNLPPENRTASFYNKEPLVANSPCFPPPLLKHRK